MLKVQVPTLAVAPFWSWKVDSFRVQKGQMAWLKGENGIGKSTFFQLIGGLFPNKGQVFWMGEALCSEDFLYLPSHFYDFHGLSVLGGVRMLLQATCQESCTEEQIRDLLQVCGLRGLAMRAWEQLSHGQKRILQLLPLVLTKKKVWFLDEPFVYLDAKRQNFLLGLLQKHLQKGGVCVLAAHSWQPDLPYVAWILERCVHEGG